MTDFSLRLEALGVEKPRIIARIHRLTRAGYHWTVTEKGADMLKDSEALYILKPGEVHETPKIGALRILRRFGLETRARRQ